MEKRNKLGSSLGFHPQDTLARTAVRLLVHVYESQMDN